MTEAQLERRLAAILAADVAGYSRLMGADEVGTLAALKAHRREIVDPAIAAHRGRIVKTTGDGILVEFASAVDAVTCAVAVQEKMADQTAEGSRIQFRIGINIGEILIDGDDIFGDGVNVAARVENECEPGGVYLSDDAYRQVRGKTALDFDDLGEKLLKIRPVRIYAVRSSTSGSNSGKAPSSPQAQAGALETAAGEVAKPLPLPDKPSIAVLPFTNMSGDREQEYFADGVVEDIITALSRFRSLFVIARNSSFTYKGKAVDIKQVGRELGVRYVLEGSVQRGGNRLRVNVQLIDAETGNHLWAERFDKPVADLFDMQDEIVSRLANALDAELVAAEARRAERLLHPDATDLYFQGMAYTYKGLTNEYLAQARGFFERALALDPDHIQALVGTAGVDFTRASMAR